MCKIEWLSTQVEYIHTIIIFSLLTYFPPLLFSVNPWMWHATCQLDLASHPVDSSDVEMQGAGAEPLGDSWGKIWVSCQSWWNTGVASYTVCPLPPPYIVQHCHIFSDRFSKSHCFYSLNCYSLLILSHPPKACCGGTLWTSCQALLFCSGYLLFLRT